MRADRPLWTRGAVFCPGRILMNRTTWLAGSPSGTCLSSGRAGWCCELPSKRHDHGCRVGEGERSSRILAVKDRAALEPARLTHSLMDMRLTAGRLAGTLFAAALALVGCAVAHSPATAEATRLPPPRTRRRRR